MNSGLIIFVAPESTTQLTAGFAIAGSFFVYHVRTNPFVHDEDDTAEMLSSLSICLTLFAGILLRTEAADEAPMCSCVCVCVVDKLFNDSFFCRTRMERC